MTRFSVSLFMYTALIAAGVFLSSNSAQAQTFGNGPAAWTAGNDTARGFNIDDASLPASSQGDAFDGALVTSVNGTVMQAASVSGVTTTSLGQYLTGTGTVAGLNYTKEFLAYTANPILRTSLSFVNPTASAITFSLLLQNNVGSDSSTQVITTSSGDTAFTTADNYIITDDSTTSGDPTNTHVLYAGGLAPDVVGQLVFTGAGTEGISAQFSSVTIGAGQTASFLFFNRLDSTSANAVAYAPTFATGSSIAQAGLVSDLSAAQLGTVRNGSFGGVVVPEAPTALLALPGLGLLGTVLLRRRKK